MAAGADPQIERDDETGQVIYDHRDMLLYHTITAEETKCILNKSIAVAAFHHWERSARGWTKKPNGKFATLCEHVTAKGYPVSPKLKHLHLLVNLLKHSNAKHASELFVYRPDYFRKDCDPASGSHDWFDVISLNDGHVVEILDTIAASGPSGSVSS